MVLQEFMLVSSSGVFLFIHQPRSLLHTETVLVCALSYTVLHAKLSETPLPAKKPAAECPEPAHEEGSGEQLCP